MKKIKMIFAACFIMGVLFYCPRFSVKAMAYETAWFPAPQMNLSQIAYETGSGSSHGDYNAIDILPIVCPTDKSEIFSSCINPTVI